MEDHLFSVEDQVVLVSGGSRGIGRAIAQGFVERGAHVVISGRELGTLKRTADEISTNQRRVIPVECDVADNDSTDRLTDNVISELERIDTLVNVAGVNRRMKAEDYTADDYDFVMDINLRGAFFLSQSVGRHMISRQSGNQINIASLNTFRPLKMVQPYAMSKAGMGAMTRGLALEWGPHHVRVNAIAPGFILTDLTEKLWSDPKMQAWNQQVCPQQRLGKPEDMVGTAIFLASTAADFLTGANHLRGRRRDCRHFVAA